MMEHEEKSNLLPQRNETEKSAWATLDTGKSLLAALTETPILGYAVKIGRQRHVQGLEACVCMLYKLARLHCEQLHCSNNNLL